MIEWIKTTFFNKPNTTTPLTAEWLNKFQDFCMQIGLINDYVAAYGENSNGKWEKYASGKLVQRGVYVINLIDTDYEVNFPLTFTDSNQLDIILIGNIVRSGGYNNFNSVIKGVNGHKRSFVLRAEMSTGSTTTFPFHWLAIGRWK